jgi:hypothetical protein
MSRFYNQSLRKFNFLVCCYVSNANACCAGFLVHSDATYMMTFLYDDKNELLLMNEMNLVIAFLNLIWR